MAYKRKNVCKDIDQKVESQKEVVRRESYGDSAKKVPFYKKKWFIPAVAAILVMGAIGSFSDSPAPEETPSAVVTGTTTATPQSGDPAHSEKAEPDPVTTTSQPAPAAPSPEPTATATLSPSSDPEPTAAPPAVPTPDPAPSVKPAGGQSTNGGGGVGTGAAGSGDANNFNTYDNPDQQQTSATYVLNTNRMKFHYPNCSSVKKIAPDNYAEYTGTRDEVIAKGYSPCGKCDP